MIVCAISALALMGYLSGADSLFAVAKLTAIAMQTATVLLALALSVLATVPEYEPVRTLQAHSAAGLLARRSLPFIIGLPLFLGWLRIRGQHAGWFDTAMGTALLVLALVAIFCGLLWWWVAAVARHETELAAARDLLATTVASIGDAVIATDSNGDVLFLNPEAERLTGWKGSEARGKPLPNIFHIVNEHTRQPVDNPVEKVFRTGNVVGLANHTLLVSKNGAETPIDDSAAPIRENDGPIIGVVLVFRDVTTQRKTQEISARLAAIVEFSGDAIITKNLDGTIRTWNAGAERLFDYRAEEIIGKPVTILFPPDRLHEEDGIFENLRQGQLRNTLETIRIAKDGREIPVLLSVSPLKDADGHLIGVSKVIHDITELVAAREALMREKELLATTLASIGDAVIVTDAGGCVTFLNGQAETLTGWKAAEAAGHRLPEIFRIVNEQTRQPVENPVEKVLRLGTVVGLANHTILIGKDGRETPIDDSAAPIRQADGPLFGVVLVFRDFSEHKKREHLLAANHAITRTLAEASALSDAVPELLRTIGNSFDWQVGALWVLDHEHSRLRCLRIWQAPSINADQFEKVSSLSTFSHNKSLPGRVWTDLQPVWIPDLAHDTNFVRVKEAVAAGLHAAFAFPVLSGDKLLGVMEFFSPQFREPDDEMLALLGGSGSQIGQFMERKQAEEALRDAHEQLGDRAIHLEKLVQERTTKLQDMVNELQHVSYAIAHDMRAPLRAMNTFASLLSQEGETTPEERQEYGRRIMVAASRLDRLIQDALHYTKVVQQEIQLGPVDLAKLVRDLIETYPNLHSEKADIFIEGELPVVSGNDSLLTQCFSNLLGNAVKFVPPGGKPEVRIHSENRDGAATIWVRDKGIGIPKNAQPRLFGMFQKLDDQYEGTGIGLAIVRKVVERMGGKVGVESELGRGSSFWVELPLANSREKERIVGL